ncbi:hypothetical protein BpHYR1_052878 [Brachionus plicatilis]|uniref:Uncharacterized protein n=1 Tax=Brachionus plicatilis TaxID=10195 RepID=A0A3M7RJF8_BRAPC|nr:hypothetical protein BpHYR1_052878 [Brachionus plicatilis]
MNKNIAFFTSINYGRSGLGLDLRLVTFKQLRIMIILNNKNSENSRILGKRIDNLYSLSKCFKIDFETSS